MLSVLIVERVFVVVRGLRGEGVVRAKWEGLVVVGRLTGDSSGWVQAGARLGRAKVGGEEGAGRQVAAKVNSF